MPRLSPSIFETDSVQTAEIIPVSVDFAADLATAEQIASRKGVRDVPVAETVRDYAVRLVLATHPESAKGECSVPMAAKFIHYGSSPRGVQSLILAAKARSLLSGRPNVSFDDIRAVVPFSLCHRIILNLEAEAEGITAEKVLGEVLKEVPELL